MTKKFTFSVLAAACCLAANAAVGSVDDLVGVYIPTATGNEYITNYTTATDMSAKTYNVEISKNEDGTITISNLLNFGSSLIGTVNLEKNTITIAPSAVSWATFASSSGIDENVVAKFNASGKISFTNFAGWYGEDNYISSGATIMLTKTSITKDWEVKGSLYFGNYVSDEEEERYHTARTTLAKYSGTDEYDYVLKFDYEYANPGILQLKVASDGAVTIANGYPDISPTLSGKYVWYVLEDIYYAWLDTTPGYANLKGDQTGGELYIYHKAYKEGSNDPAYSGYLDFTWGISDGIAAPSADKAQKPAPVYDLMGRRVATPSAAGIYIQGGKKFLVK